MAIRGGAVLALATSAVLLAGCHSATPGEPSTAAKSTTSTNEAGPYDLSRLAHFNEAFPQEFVADSGAVEEVLTQYAGSAGSLVSSSTPVGVDPQRCAPLLRPVVVSVGAPSIGIRGEGPDRQGVAMQAYDPTVPVDGLPSSGCDRFSIVVDADVPRHGVVERLDGPAIDGAIVIALRTTFEGVPTPDYDYAAIVDGRAFIRVQGRLGPGYAAQQLLSDLLAKAVAALRGEIRLAPRPAGAYNLAGLGDLDAAFPEGYEPAPEKPSTYRIGPELLASAGTSVTYGEPFAADPQVCGTLLKPIAAELGADAVRTRGDQANARAISIGAITPVEVPVALPIRGCERFSYQLQGAKLSTRGTVERITAPTIEGATTFALKVTVEGAPDPEYSYVAVVGDNTYVDVQARVAPDTSPDVLSDLLVKAVAAIRS